MSQVPPPPGGQDDPSPQPFVSPTAANPPPAGPSQPDATDDPAWVTPPVHAPGWQPAPYPDQAPSAPPAFAPEDQRIPKAPMMRRRWWLVILVVVVLAIIALVVWLAARPSSGARPADITEQTDIAISQIAVGDCLKPLPAPGITNSVSVVPCSQYHSGQIVGKVTVKEAAAYPGEAALAAEVRTSCSTAWGKALAQVNQVADTTLTTGTTVIVPSQDSWGGGDRSGWCLVYGVDGEMAGSLVG